MSTVTPSRRLFFSLWPDERIRSEIMRRVPADVPNHARVMAASNLHVTLAFLGAVAESQLPTLLALASDVTFAGCELVFDRYTCWPKPKVLVLLAREVPDTLQSLVMQLNERLTAHGFHVDSRAYQPHVTLVRGVRMAVEASSIEPLRWTARRFVLVESRSSDRGVQYQVLAQFA